MNIIINELLIKFIKQNKKLIITYIILILMLFPVKTILLPIYFSKILNVLKDNTNYKLSIKNKIIQILFIILLIKLFIIILNFFNNKKEATITAKNIIYCRTKMLKNLLILKSNNFNNIKIGEIIIRILNVSRSFKYLLISLVTKYIPFFMSILSIIIYFLYIDPLLGSITMVLYILLIIIIYKNNNKLINFAVKNENKSLEINEKINDSLNNLFHILINNQINSQINENKKHMMEWKKTYINEIKNINHASLMFSFFNYFIFIILISYSLLLLFRNKLKFKNFLTIFIILTFIYPVTLDTITETMWSIHYCGEIKASEKFLNYILRNNYSEQKKISIDGDIVFKNITFKYPNINKCVICNLSLKINKNDKIALIGQSGSGKSTLMKLLLGLNKVNKGEILINGTNINKINKYQLRKNIIYVNQNTNLFDKSVLNNILFGNNSTKENIIELLNKYNLNKVYQKLDKGIYSNVGPNGLNLSLGMQKVTIILRSILKKSKIIIFDEPLSGLDKETRIKIINLIKNECKYKTLIIITHDKEIFQLCNKILNLANLNNK